MVTIPQDHIPARILSVCEYTVTTLALSSNQLSLVLLAASCIVRHNAYRPSPPSPKDTI